MKQSNRREIKIKKMKMHSKMYFSTGTLLNIIGMIAGGNEYYISIGSLFLLACLTCEVSKLNLYNKYKRIDQKQVARKILEVMGIKMDRSLQVSTFQRGIDVPIIQKATLLDKLKAFIIGEGYIYHIIKTNDGCFYVIDSESNKDIQNSHCIYLTHFEKGKRQHSKATLEKLYDCFIMKKAA